jgi:hypothetical protein
LNTQTDKVNLAALATFQPFQLFGQGSTIGGVLAIRYENDGEVDILDKLGHLILQLFEGTKNVSSASTVVFEILAQDRRLLNAWPVIKGNNKLSDRCHRGIPEFDHLLPIATHRTGGVNNTNDKVRFFLSDVCRQPADVLLYDFGLH